MNANQVVCVCVDAQCLTDTLHMQMNTGNLVAACDWMVKTRGKEWVWKHSASLAAVHQLRQQGVHHSTTKIFTANIQIKADFVKECYTDMRDEVCLKVKVCLNVYCDDLQWRHN